MGNQLPPGDHVVRYIRPGLVREDKSPDGLAFCLRAERPDESGLSVNWLEAAGSATKQQLREGKSGACLGRRCGRTGGSPSST